VEKKDYNDFSLGLTVKNFWQKSCFTLGTKMAGKICSRVAILACVALLTSCSLLPKRPAAKNTLKTFKTVVVDAGHGGKDTGAYRRSGPPEKVVTLDVAKRLDRKLRESQLKTVMTRSGDVFISLDDRVEIENSKKNSIFVSIHFNDSRRRGIHGFETYYHSEDGRQLAESIQGKLMTIPNSVNRGIHFANFRVLRLATYPAVLVECGFLSNRKEGREARDAEYRELLADRIAEAVVETRYGPGVYRAAGEASAKPAETAVPESSGPGLAPATLRHD
jgi:N-acetylmuramoyl-L-alanine amidase